MNILVVAVICAGCCVVWYMIDKVRFASVYVLYILYDLCVRFVCVCVCRFHLAAAAAAVVVDVVCCAKQRKQHTKNYNK